MRILYIALAGIAGTLARYSFETWIHGPTATLAVNLLGSFVLGFIMHYAIRSTAISVDLRGALTIGFCGAFTTMSTFSYESLGLVLQGSYARAVAYMGATLVGCLATVFGGMALAERVVSGLSH